MNICFFCASSNTIDAKYHDAAIKFAEEISKRDWTLVSGGTNRGLMQTLAKHTTSAGIGVIPKIFSSSELVCYYNKNIIITENLYERKKILFQKSDAFVILPGGFGTLDELIEIITLKIIGEHQKPIIIFNLDNFFDNILKQFDVSIENNFATNDCKSAYIVETDIMKIFEYLEK